MFTNNKRQEERTGKYGTPRVQYLQELVSRFQNASDEETKEQVVANLANFAYDPFNYTFLRQLNIIELFLDCITEPNEKLVEFGIGGICNCSADPANAALVTQSGGIPLVIQCLSSPVRNTKTCAVFAGTTITSIIIDITTLPAGVITFSSSSLSFPLISLLFPFASLLFPLASLSLFGIAVFPPASLLSPLASLPFPTFPCSPLRCDFSSHGVTDFPTDIHSTSFTQS